MNTNWKRLFFYYGDITEGIFDSQVLSFIRFQQKIGFEFTLLCFIPLKSFITNYNAMKKALTFIKSQGIKCKYVLTFNPINLLGKITNTLYVYFFALIAFFSNPKRENIILHARGLWGVWLAAHIKRLMKRSRLIYDIREDKVAEFDNQSYNSMSDKNNTLSKIQNIQNNGILKSDICLLISKKLKEVIESRGTRFNEFYIIPSIGQSDIFSYDKQVRDSFRQSMALDEKFIVGYSGSMHSWQRVDKVKELFKIVRNRRKNAALVIFTKEVEKARDIFGEFVDTYNILIKSIAYESLGKYIQIFDMGLLLRDQLLLNRVASPTKFSEYILCGVPTFISSGIGDLDEIVETENLGSYCRNIEDESILADAAEKFLEKKFDRSKIAEYGKKHFCRESYAEIYSKIYNE